MNPYSDFSMPAFERFLVWLSASDLRHFFYRFEQFDGFVLFLHALSAAALFGSILIMDVALLRSTSPVAARDVARLTLPWASGGAVGAISTGLILFLFDPIATGVHSYFLPKMALIVLGVADALVFHSLGGVSTESARQMRERTFGALSLLIWTGVFLCASLNQSERLVGGPL